MMCERRWKHPKVTGRRYLGGCALDASEQAAPGGVSAPGAHPAHPLHCPELRGPPACR